MFSKCRINNEKTRYVYSFLIHNSFRKIKTTKFLFIEMDNYIVYVGYLTIILYSIVFFFVESVTKNIEEDREIQNCLLKKTPQIQDMLYKLNESLDNANSKAMSS